MRNFKNNKRRFRSNSFERNLKISSSDQNLTSLGNISDFKKIFQEEILILQN